MKSGSMGTKNASQSDLNLPNQQRLFTIDLTNPSWDDIQITENMKERQNEYKHCFELNIKNCNLVSLGFPFELIYLGKLNVTRTKLQKIENINYTANISTLNLSNNQLKKMPDIYSLTKLEMLFLNDNFIEKVDFNHFKDLRNLRIINLQSNRVSFRDVNEFTSNMLFVRDKLKQLKSFAFLLNTYYTGSPKERISDFLDFFQRSFLSNLNFESEKDKLEKEFNSKIEEIMDFQQRQSESLSSKVYQIKKQIEAFSLNPNSIEMKMDKFKENTNNFLHIMNSSENQSKLISAKSAVDSESQELEALFCDIIRDLNILTDKVDSKAFIEQCMHFLVGILRIKQGFLAESIMELLTHIAEHKKMEEVLIKNLIKNFTGKEHLDYNIHIAKGDDEKTLLIEEINGQSSQATLSKRDKGDEEEISLAGILKAYPKILESFKMIVNEKYDRLFVYLFRILLKNIKYGKLMASLPSAFEAEGRGGFSDKEGKGTGGGASGALGANDANSFVFYAMEFFFKCFSGKAKKRILQSLHRYEIMKLIAIAIGIFRKYEFCLKESGSLSASSRNDKKIQNWFLDIVATFGKIFKSIFKYFYMPYLNKKVFSDSNEFERNQFLKYLKVPSTYSKKDIDASLIKNNDLNNNNPDAKIEEISEYQKQKYIGEYLQSNFRIVISDIISKDLNVKNKNRDLKFENLSEDNFYSQFEIFLTMEILENYKQNIMLYRKRENSNNSSNDNFILSNKILGYFLKINVLIKGAFLDPSSNSYLKSLNEFYMILYREFAKRLDDGEYGGGNFKSGTRMEKSRSNINLRINALRNSDNNIDKDEYNNQGDSDDQNKMNKKSVLQPQKSFVGAIGNNTMYKNRGLNNNLQSERDFFYYDPLMLNSLNFILNLILHQNSLYSQFSDDGYLIDFQDKLINILKRIDETSNDYKLIFRFANFYENKKEEVAETNIVALSSLSNQYLIKFINSSLNILVFLGKLNELCSTQKKELESDNNNLNNILEKSLTINQNNNNNKTTSFINLNNNNNNNKSIFAGKLLAPNQIGVQAGEKIVDKITSKLNENNRDDIMLKCINIPNMNIKRKIMEILLTVNYEQISEVEFDGLVTTLKNSNFLDMNMEDIVTKSFLFIIRLLNQKINKKEDRLFRIDNAIECGIKIALDSNTRNYFSEESKFKSAQNLNLILSVFLINLSTERKFDKIYCNKEVRDNNNDKKQNAGSSNFQMNQNLESIKKIIFYEYESVKKITENNQDLVGQMFPLLYEKIYGMWNVNNIRDFLVNYSIYPYNFVVFRLFRNMADVLMNVPYSIFNVFEEKEKLEKVIENLKDEFKQREVKAVEEEKKNWNFLKKNNNNNSNNNNNNNNNNLNNYGNKTNNLENKKNAKILNLKMFENLMNNVSSKPQFITLSEENWKEQKLLFFDKFRDFLNFLCGEPHFINEVKTRLEDFKYDFRLKNPDQSAFGEKGSEENDRLRANLYWGNQENSLNENQRKGSNSNEDQGLFNRFTNLFNKNDAENDNNINNGTTNNNINNNNNNNNSTSQRKNSMHISNLEPIIKTYLQTIDKGANTKHFNFNFYSHIKEDLREECDTYGTSAESVFRVKEHETVDNCYLRSLIIAAFLRCIFSLTKNANKKSGNSHSSGAFGRFNLVETLRNPYIFQKLIMLVDSTKLQDCNINTKILTIIKHVFEKISKNFAEKNPANSDKKMNSAYGNPNKNSKANEARNAGGNAASKHDFSRLVNISSIIIEKTLDNIYFNQRAFSQEVSEESYTALVRKLVKCCLCIKKEIFKINLTLEEKKDLLKKILSTRLILVLINHALKIMENDIPLQKQLQTQESNLVSANANNANVDKNVNENNGNSHNENDNGNNINFKEEKRNKNKDMPQEIEYNEYFVDLLILLAEFISCRQEIYIIIIEYVCKKYYIQKRPIRQSFIKDLADLRNYSFSSQIQRDKGIQENYDNILFISVSKIIFAYYEDKNKSVDFESKKNTKISQNLIKNEICILILDQTNLVIKKFNQYKKALDFSDIKEAKTLAILRIKEEVKDVRYFPYGNRIFLRQKDNMYVLSLLFKKSIESHLFLSAIKNVEKRLEFRAIESELDKEEDPNSNDNKNDQGDDLRYGYKLCGKNCYNTQEQKDVVDINKKNKRSRSKNNKDANENKNEEINLENQEEKSNNNKTHNTKIRKIKTNNIENENENLNNANQPENLNSVRKKIGVNNPNSDIRSVSSNRTNKKDKISNFNDKESKASRKTLRKNENEENKSNNNNVNFGDANKNFIVDSKLTGEEKFKYLKELREKRTEEKNNNKLNDSIASYNSNSSLRSKSGKMMSVKVLKNKLLNKQNEEKEKNAENNNQNDYNIDLTKYTFNNKIFIGAIDFSSFSNVDDLNEEALYRNLYIIKLIGNDKIKIFKEKENKFAEMIIDSENNKNSFEEKFYKGLGDAIHELNSFELDSVKNILFDNRKIIIEFRSTVNYILNRPIQIYPVDDRGFFYLRNFFVRFIYMRGFHNFSRNFLTEAISTRIFKN